MGYSRVTQLTPNKTRSLEWVISVWQDGQSHNTMYILYYLSAPVVVALFKENVIFSLSSSNIFLFDFTFNLIDSALNNQWKIFQYEFLELCFTRFSRRYRKVNWDSMSNQQMTSELQYPLDYFSSGQYTLVIWSALSSDLTVWLWRSMQMSFAGRLKYTHDVSDKGKPK